jgi:LuxR family maltose regulon positive regulatory protein
LLAVLAAAERTRLTLVSAPAGTGKTTLVADWARQLVLRAPTGWVTFEEDTALWPDLFGCLGRLGVPVPELDPSESGASSISRSQLTTVAEGIAAAPQRMTVVLDGYELAGPDEARDLHYLLEHSMGRLGVVLITRVDPVLPLYRYRLDGGLTELRVADLAFTDEEAAELLREAGVRLDTELLHALNTRVRGWAAGLRFAARALVDDAHPGRTAVAAVTSGADVNEYLLGEVLDVQSPEVRRFLLETSVADVLSPSLVTALFGPAARHLLSELGHLNTFAETVPGQPGCYRYYPFFKELLQAQLAYEQPVRWKVLHATAATWCRHEGLPDRALAHLAAIEAWPEVAELLVASDQISVLLSEGVSSGPVGVAANRLPRDVATPEAALVRAAAALARGDAHECSHELDRARAHLTAGDGSTGPHPSPSLHAAIAVVDAARSTMVDPAEQAVRLATSADDAIQRAQRAAGLRHPGQLGLLRRCQGVSATRRGDLRRARAHLEDGLGLAAEGAGMPSGVRADLLGHLALVDALEGHLARASRTAEVSLALADGKRSTAVCHGEAAAHLALGAVALERCHPREARHHVAVATASPALCGHPLCQALSEMVAAGADRAGGDLGSALSRLGAGADRLTSSDPWLADRMRLEAARLGLAVGRSQVALTALDGVGRPDEPHAAAVAAVVLAERGHLSAVDDRLGRLHHRPATLQSEVLALLAEGSRALQHHETGRARAALDRSLRLAAPEGLRRPFRDGGPMVQRLLSADPVVLREHRWLTSAGTVSRAPAGPRGSSATTAPTSPTSPPASTTSTTSNASPASASSPSPARAATTAAPYATGPERAASAPRQAPSTSRTPQGAPVEELTAKELEVLGHLAELLNTEEIAATMFISVNTVRTHVRNILRKLDVNRRNAAVRRARELGLLGDEPALPPARAIASS